MKKCSDCNVEMVDGKLHGEPFSMNLDNDIDDFYVDIKTGGVTSFFGMKVPSAIRARLEVKVCPKCGKVELYIDPNSLKQKN